MKRKITFALLLLSAQAILAQTQFTNTGFGSSPGYSCLTIPGQTRALGDIINVGNTIYGLTGFGDSNLLKFTADGNLITSFGTNGIVPLDINPGQASFGDNSSCFLRLTPDNNLLMVVNSYVENFMVKTDLDGNVITGFGSNGYAPSPSPDMTDFLYTEIINNEIVIVAQGYFIDENNPENYVLVMKYDLNGNPVTSFGTNGRLKFTTDLETSAIFATYNPAQNAVYAILQQYGSMGELTSSVVKYNINTGSLDTEFGTDGYIQFVGDMEHFKNASVLWADTDSSVYISGTYGTYGGDVQIFLEKYDAVQELDLSFGSQGAFTYNLADANEYVTDIVKTNNTIRLSGTESHNSGYQKIFYLKTTNGILDESFGVNGKMVAEVFPSNSIMVYKTIEDNGFYTIATTSNLCSGSSTEFTPTIMKLNSGETADIPVNTNTTKVYPNPVKDYLYFNSSATVTKAEIYDISGKLLAVPADVNEGRANLTTLRRGIYILKLDTAEGTTTIKVIKD